MMRTRMFYDGEMENKCPKAGIELGMSHVEQVVKGPQTNRTIIPLNNFNSSPRALETASQICDT